MSSDPVADLYDLDSNGTLKNHFPELANLRMEIPKGWRHKDNLTHSIKVLENSIKSEESPDLIMRTAALFHDVGKPATRELHARGEVTFNSHEVVGARMLRKQLPKWRYNSQEVSAISNLVALHMRSFGYSDNNWSDSALRKLLHDSNGDMDRLLVLFKSDITTRHNAKRLKLTKAIDKLSNEIARVRKEDERKKLRPALNGNEVMELFGLTPGKKLGQIMKTLNSDAYIHLTRDEAKSLVSQIILEIEISRE